MALPNKEGSRDALMYVLDESEGVESGNERHDVK